MKLRIGLVLAWSVLLSGCATVDSFNRTAETITRQAIEQSERNRCTVHVAPCLSDAQFQHTNLELNKVAVAGREFTKLRIAGTASLTDASTFLRTVATSTANLSAAFTDGAIKAVLDKLTELQGKVTKLMGKMS